MKLKNKFVKFYIGIFTRKILLRRGGLFKMKRKRDTFLAIARKYLKGNFTQELHANWFYIRK